MLLASLGGVQTSDTWSSDDTDASHLRFLLPVLRHLRALRAKVARLRVLGFLLLFIARSLLAGIGLPFFAPAARRSLPLLLKWWRFAQALPLTP